MATLGEPSEVGKAMQGLLGMVLIEGESSGREEKVAEKSEEGFC